MVDQSGEDAGLNLALSGKPRPAEELHAVAELPGKVDIHAIQIADALDRHGRVRVIQPPGEADKQHEFMGGVKTVNIQCGVRLRVAVFLRAAQGRREVHAPTRHFRKNKIGRAVENAFNRQDTVAGQAVLQRLDDGDAAGHAGFVQQGGFFLSRLSEKICPVFGQKRLVGGHHMLAVVKTGRNELLGCRDAPHQFDDDINIGIPGKLGGVGGQARARGEIALARGVTHGNGFEAEFTAGTLTQFLGVFPEQPDKTAADGPEAGKAEGEGGARVHDHSMIDGLPGQVTKEHEKAAGQPKTTPLQAGATTV